MGRQTIFRTVSALALAALPAGAVAAGELCVVCREPAVTYRCGPQAGETLDASDPRFAVLCITELAKVGKHQACSVDRVRPTTACEGQLVELARPAAAAAPEPVAKPDPGAPGAAASAGGVAQPTDTVEALAKRTAAQTQAELKAANAELKANAEKTGGVLKRSFECVISLFSKC